MSVRPITESEQRQAWGAPWTSWLMIFGATQGLIAHLRFSGATVQGPWMPTTMARFTLPVFVIGGAAVGTVIGIKFFGDEALRRLQTHHLQDRAYQVESQKYQVQH
jgi:hypothetical protein